MAKRLMILGTIILLTLLFLFALLQSRSSFDAGVGQARLTIEADIRDH